MKRTFELNGKTYEMIINENDITKENSPIFLGLQMGFNNYGEEVMMDVYTKEKIKHLHVYVYFHNLTDDTYSQIYRDIQGKTIKKFIKEAIKTDDIVEYLNITEKELIRRSGQFYSSYFNEAE